MFNALVVDDNNATQLLLSRILKRQFHCNISIAKDGKEALNKVILKKPDFIIADYMMPHMNGYEFIQRIKKNKFYSDIPVIVMSAVSEKESIERMISLGVLDYILKPLDLEKVIGKIATVMYERNSGLSKKLYSLEKRLDLLEQKNQKLEKESKNITLDKVKFSIN